VNRRLLTALMLGCLLVGVVVMVVLELAIGVVLLFAFIVIGVFLIADPAFLGEEDDEGAGSRRA
jgi:hypothetical protein